MTLHLPRRSLLTGLASLLAAPAVVRASSLMPVVPIVRPLRGPPEMTLQTDELLHHRFIRMAGSIGPDGKYSLWWEGSHDNTSWEKLPGKAVKLRSLDDPVTLPMTHEG